MIRSNQLFKDGFKVWQQVQYITVHPNRTVSLSEFRFSNYNNKRKETARKPLPPGGGYSQTNLAGLCGLFPKTPTLLMTKIFDFPCSIYVATKISDTVIYDF